MTGKFLFCAALAGSAALGMGNFAVAGSLKLGNSGWTASWSSAFDDASSTFVTLTVLQSDLNTVQLQKVAAFRGSPDQFGLIEPIEINFEQTSANAAQNIWISSEEISNDTTTPWNSFQFIIEDGQTGTSADTQFDVNASFGGATKFTTTPFSFVSATGISSSPQVITVGNGTLNPGETWTPGIGPGTGGELVIHAAPSADGTKRFVLKELPNPGTGPVIPLPAAAWTGLSSLAGLAIIGLAKRLRRPG